VTIVNFDDDTTHNEVLFDGTQDISKTVFWTLSDGSTTEFGFFSVIKVGVAAFVVTNFQPQEEFAANTEFLLDVLPYVNVDDFGISLVGEGPGTAMTFEYKANMDSPAYEDGVGPNQKLNYSSTTPFIYSTFTTPTGLPNATYLIEVWGVINSEDTAAEVIVTIDYDSSQEGEQVKQRPVVTSDRYSFYKAFKKTFSGAKTIDVKLETGDSGMQVNAYDTFINVRFYS